MRLPRATVVVLFAALLAGIVWFLLSDTHNVGADDSNASAATGATPAAQRAPNAHPMVGRDAGTSSTGGASAPSNPTPLDPLDSGASATARDARNAEWLKRNAALAEKYVDHFCEENRALTKSMPVPPAHGTRDAAEFMASRIDWEDHKVADGTLHLPEALHGKLRATGTDWALTLGPSDIAGLDFGWMHQLFEYDSWDVARYGPWTDPRVTDFANAPIPNYISLLEWSKLRFVRAFADGDFVSADAEVRHLASLIESNGLLIGDVIAAALITRVIATAREAAVQSGRDVSAWPAPDVTGATRMGRVAMAGSSFFAPGVSDEVMKKARDCLAYPCSALSEGLGLQLSVGPGASADAVERYAREANCSTRLLDVVRRTRPRIEDHPFNFADVPGVWSIYPDGGVP